MQATASTPTLRALRLADVGAIVGLAALIGSAETAADWRRRLRSGTAVVAIGAQEDGRLVGYVAGEVRAAFGLPAAGWVEAFGVDNGWRGQGLGRSLAGALLARFRELGTSQVYTLLPLHDRTLAPFFRDLGFREEPLACLGRTV
ncbi:MAG TPA: GNAT family N-acetyltransferase [Candidatus Limnocylindria bacterium]|nr:GNAT family N-acetyltransferase [Candidatus Limnocylindria bacterium]